MNAPVLLTFALLFVAVVPILCESNKLDVFSRSVAARQFDFLTCPLQEFLDLAEPMETQCRNALVFELSSISSFEAEFSKVYEIFTTICTDSVCREQVLNVATRCLSELQARQIGTACAQNSNGDFCFQTIVINNGTYVAINCGGLLYGNSTECNQTCRETVEQFRDDQSSCVCSVFNTTDFGLLDYGFADYRLWSTCDVNTVCDAEPTSATSPSATSPSVTSPSATSPSAISNFLALLCLLCISFSV